VSKPNDPCPGDAKQRRARRAALTGVALVGGAIALLLQLPFGMTAALAASTGERGGSQLPPRPAATTQSGPATYQLRCWQYGRLLFDEGPVTLGAEARQGARLVAIDRHGAPLIVTDAGGTTCLARPSPAPRSLALPQ
jgi:hypothetical protein